jgi:hypothetical protein
MTFVAARGILKYYDRAVELTGEMPRVIYADYSSDTRGADHLKPVACFLRSNPHA